MPQHARACTFLGSASRTSIPPRSMLSTAFQASAVFRSMLAKAYRKPGPQNHARSALEARCAISRKKEEVEAKATAGTQ